MGYPTASTIRFTEIEKRGRLNCLNAKKMKIVKPGIPI